MLNNVEKIIAVASGKGGVGKSTLAVNLAICLAQQGARVGLLDADIYGPNQPKMLGISEKPQVHEDKTFEPIVSHGLLTMSLGYLVGVDTPMIWRGPLASKAFEQMLNDTRWPKLDYLIMDLPPGTGDIQLTMAKKTSINGVVIVTTPQEVALQDVRKGIEMFQKVKVPILGIVENMSMHVCTACGHQEAIFGTEGADKLKKEYRLAMLGQLPLDASICKASDQGKPITVSQPESTISKAYQSIAKQVSEALSQQPKDYSRLFSNIVVEDK